jgi:hypothetical protein
MPPVITNEKITSKHTPALAPWNRSPRSCTMRCAELISTRPRLFGSSSRNSSRCYGTVTGIGVKLITTLPTQAGWQANPEWRSVTARTHPASIQQ